MKLLAFVPEPLPTHRADVTALFGRYLPLFGVETHLIGMPGKSAPDKLSFLTVQTSKATTSRLGREWSYLLLCLRAMVMTPATAFDVIQVRDMVPVGLLGLVIARLRKKPFVYWVSYLMSEERMQRASKKIALGLPPLAFIRERLVLLKGTVERWLLYKVLLPRSHHVFVQSNAMQHYIMAQGIPEEKLTPVPMGVDLAQFDLANFRRVRPTGWETDPVIAYLGTLSRARHIEHLIDVLAKVKQKNPNVKLLLIGDSPDSNDVAALSKYAADLGLCADVKITGWLASHEALPLLISATVAISYFPRDFILDTCSPTKLVEYLALALPCVGNDNPDQAAVLADSCAGFLTTSSVQNLATAVLEVIQNLPAAQKKALFGPEFVKKNRSYEVIAEKLSRKYFSLSAPK